jgi:hypothetical protein
MNKRVLIFFFTILIITNFAYSQKKTIGVGIMVGEPTGISLKYWMSSKDAIDGGIGMSFYKASSLHLHADYLYHDFKLFSENFPFYLGVGGRLKMNNNEKEFDTQLGIRVPFGLAYMPSTSPLDAFLEIVPILDFITKGEFSFNSAIGVRYYFK